MTSSSRLLSQKEEAISRSQSLASWHLAHPVLAKVRGLCSTSSCYTRCQWTPHFTSAYIWKINSRHLAKSSQLSHSQLFVDIVGRTYRVYIYMQYIFICRVWDSLGCVGVGEVSVINQQIHQAETGSSWRHFGNRARHLNPGELLLNFFRFCFTSF